MARRPLVTLAALAVAAFASAGRAQETPKPEPAPAREAPPVPRADRLPTSTVQVQVVISRFQGEKKVASLPYSFLLPAVPATGGPGSPQNRARMRMGVDTPVPKTSSGGATEVQYRNVGTNIDCWVADLGDGRHQVSLTVENSSALAGPEAGGGAGTASGLPLFRRFETSLAPTLRPGQSVQAIASTDPVTGEVVKVDVTLNVLK